METAVAKPEWFEKLLSAYRNTVAEAKREPDIGKVAILWDCMSKIVESAMKHRITKLHPLYPKCDELRQKCARLALLHS